MRDQRPHLRAGRHLVGGLWDLLRLIDDAPGRIDGLVVVVVWHGAINGPRGKGSL